MTEELYHATLTCVSVMAIVPSLQEDFEQFDQEPKASLSSPFLGKPNSILKAEATKSDEKFENNFDNSLRPKTFDDYIGQKKLKEILNISISAAKKRSDLASVGHILLYGPPGLGKTSCACLLANELKTEAKIFSAPALERPKDIIGILMSLNDGDVLFIDEIHRLNKITEELLYPALEDYQIDLATGKGASARVMRFKINKFILVGATTKLGYLSAPLRDRFIHIHRMEYYDVDELKQIALKTAQILNVSINNDAANVLAERSRGTPRIINRFVRLVRDFAHHHELELVDEKTAHQALDLYRIDKSGLDVMDRKILETIIKNHGGGPVGLDTIASTLGEDRMTIEDYYEPFLIQAGFLLRTPRGRAVTDNAYKYLEIN